MSTTARLSFGLATGAILLAAMIINAGPALLLGEAQASPRLLRESWPIEARLPEDAPQSICVYVTPPVRHENSASLQVKVSRLYSTLSEPPSHEIEEPFPETSRAY